VRRHPCPPRARPCRIWRPPIRTEYRSNPALAAAAGFLVLLVSLANGATGGEGSGGEEFEGREIEELILLDIPAPEQSALLLQLGLRKGKQFDLRMVEADRTALEALGYRVREVRVLPRPDGRLRVWFDLNERLRIASLYFKGIGRLRQRALQARLQSKTKERYNARKANIDERLVEDQLRQWGYSFCRVRHEFRKRPDGRAGILIFNVSRGAQVKVVELELKGVRTFPLGTLRRQMQTRQARGAWQRGRLDPLTLEDDLRALTRFYRNHGFLDVAIREPQIVDKESRDKHGNLRIHRRMTIEIGEGPIYQVREVRIEGNTVFSDEEILRAINRARRKRDKRHRKEYRIGPLVPGSVWPEEAQKFDAIVTRELYGSVGRIDTQVVVTVAPTGVRPTVDVTVNVLKEGRVVRLGQIHFRGDPPPQTKPRVLLCRMSIHPGDILDPAKIRKSLLRWKRTGYFDPAALRRSRLVPGATPGTRDLVVELVEKKTGEFMIGAGTGNYENFFLRISLSQKNFDWRNRPRSWKDFFQGNSLKGGGQLMSLSAHIGQKSQDYRAVFVEPWWLNLPIALRLEAYETIKTPRGFKRSGPGAAISLTPRFGNRFAIELGYAYDDQTVEVYWYAPPSILSEAGSYQIGSLSLKLLWNPIGGAESSLPGLRGSSLNTSLWGKIAADSTGSDRSFFSVGATARGRFILARNSSGAPVVFSIRGQAGWTKGFDGWNLSPLFERFAVGGTMTPWPLRGFGYYALSPMELDALGHLEPVRGNFALIGTAELSFPIVSDKQQQVGLRGSIFYDTGNAWGDISDFDWGGLRHSVGVGVHLMLSDVGGALSFYYTYPFHRGIADDTSRFQWAISTSF